jgi:hypothetical protein
MAGKAGIAIGLGYLPADRMIVGDLNGWLVEHMLPSNTQDLNTVRIPCTVYGRPKYFSRLRWWRYIRPMDLPCRCPTAAMNYTARRPQRT